MSFSQLFNNQSTVILDGGLGTTLEDVFHRDISHTPLWSSKLIQEDPNAITEAHLSFLRAGAKVISTATYQCAFNTFERAGVGQDDARKIMLKAVQLAHEARTQYFREEGYNHKITEDYRMIALSLGPFGACLSPTQEFDGFYPPPYGPCGYSDSRNNYNVFQSNEEDKLTESIAALTQFHLERLEILANDEDAWRTIDCIAFETILLEREVQAIRKAVGILQHKKRTKSDTNFHMKPWWISLVFPKGKHLEVDRFGGRWSSMQRITEAALGDNYQRGDEDYPIPSALGINCTPTEFLPRLLSEMGDIIEHFSKRNLINLWLVVYPNGGDVYDTESRTWTAEKGKENWPHELEMMIRQLKMGSWDGIMVGGCCRTGPNEIRALSAYLTT